MPLLKGNKENLFYVLTDSAVQSEVWWGNIVTRGSCHAGKLPQSRWEKKGFKMPFRASKCVPCFQEIWKSEAWEHKSETWTVSDPGPKTSQVKGVRRACLLCWWWHLGRMALELASKGSAGAWRMWVFPWGRHGQCCRGSSLGSSWVIFNQGAQRARRNQKRLEHHSSMPRGWRKTFKSQSRIDTSTPVLRSREPHSLPKHPKEKVITLNIRTALEKKRPDYDRNSIRNILPVPSSSMWQTLEAELGELGGALQGWRVIKRRFCRKRNLRKLTCLPSFLL